MSTEATSSENAGGLTYAPLEILNQLQAIPDSEIPFSCSNLKDSLLCQREVLKTLRRFTKEPDSITLVGTDAVLLQFLKNLYHLVSSLPGTLRFDALEDAIAKSEIARPFLGNMTPDGALEVGYPSEENALCDTVSELARVAAAAVVCYFHYTNFPANPNSIGTDEGCIIFTSLALRSIQRAETIPALERDLAECGSVMTLNQLGWLMHFFRGTLLGFYAQVHGHTGKKEDQRDSLIAQQSDFLSLLKRAPENPMGYTLYARSCLQFQQHKAAYVFASRGVVVAEKHRAEWHRSQLLCEQAVALALGGADGATWKPEVAEKLTADALLALKTELRLLPEVYHDLLVVEPGPELVTKFLIPKGLEAAKDEGAKEVPVVTELYPTVNRGPLPLGSMTLVTDDREEKEENTAAVSDK